MRARRYSYRPRSVRYKQLNEPKVLQEENIPLEEATVGLPPPTNNYLTILSENETEIEYDDSVGGFVDSTITATIFGEDFPLDVTTITDEAYTANMVAIQNSLYIP